MDYKGSALEQYHAQRREEARRDAADRAKDEAARAAYKRLLELAKPARLAEAKELRKALVRHHAAKRRASKIQRTPAWADLDAIRAVYAEARRLTVETGVEHHVDHAVPLQGETVCGLHVEWNLQILTGSENIRKKNRWDPC
jgi:5-methylcytosine-specific restriction endonuclease McrA